ncbi:MAG: hypothetical protein WA110_06250, partial [Anaerolineaceae bacterium]
NLYLLFLYNPFLVKLICRHILLLFPFFNSSAEGVRQTVCVTCLWVGVNNAWEQRKLKTKKMLKNGDNPTSQVHALLGVFGFINQIPMQLRYVIFETRQATF